MHQLSWSFTDCYSTRQIILFMLVHSQLNGCSNRLGPHITMMMMFPVLCPCFTQPLTRCTFKVSLTHMNEHSFDSAIPSTSPSALPQYNTTVFMDVSERENPLPPSLLVAPLHHLLHSSPSTHAFPSSPASLSPDFLLCEQHQEAFKCARDADDSPGSSLLTIRRLFCFSLII